MIRGTKAGTKRGPYKKKIKEPMYIPYDKALYEQSNEITLDDLTLYNLTGHDISFEDGYTIKPISCVRCEQKEVLLGWVGKAPIFEVQRERTVLPRYNKNKIYIVSQIICQVHNDRNDLYLPIKITSIGGDTYCKGLSQNPFYIQPK